MKSITILFAMFALSSFIFADEQDLNNMLSKVTVHTVAKIDLPKDYWLQSEPGKSSFTVLATASKEKIEYLENFGLIGGETNVEEDGNSLMLAKRIGNVYFFVFSGMSSEVIYERELVEGDVVYVKDKDTYYLLKAGWGDRF